MTASPGPPPKRPQRQLPVLAPGAVRRLVRLDVLLTPRPDGGTTTVEASAHDELGTTDGPRLLGQARVTVGVDAGYRVVDLRASAQDVPEPLDALVGLRVFGELRAAARALLDEAPGAGPSPLAALLDDVPVAVLVSGYLALRAGSQPQVDSIENRMRDICSGWRDGGEPLTMALSTGSSPVPAVSPVGDVPLYDGFPPLPRQALRRVRWAFLTPSPDGEAQVEAGFRDSTRDHDGSEGVLHEYAVSARLDAAGSVQDLRADPRVLPFSECLYAVPEVSAVDGQVATLLPTQVPRLLPGNLGCTHLSDLLRSLACLPRLHAAAAASTP